LVTGDLEGAGEQALLDGPSLTRSEALVVSHHGSRSATSDAFLLRVQPTWGLISVGRRNPFGHPHPELLARLDSHGVRVLRTDESGTVILKAIPRGWRVSTPLTPRTAARR
jgi:competence protein ComEC